MLPVSAPEAAALPTFAVYQNQKYNKDCNMLQQRENKNMQKIQQKLDVIPLHVFVFGKFFVPVLNQIENSKNL